MKQIMTITICSICAAAAGYMATTWHYQVGLFESNIIRNGLIESKSSQRWAQPISLSGAPNLHKVSDALYRSAQPRAEGFQSLHAMGIKTVVNLRQENDDPELAKGLGLKLVHIPLMANKNPNQEQVNQFLELVNDPANLPILVHCRAGADRTGTMCAIYRIACRGWSVNDALSEMVHGGFGFHSSFDNLSRYIEQLDAPQVRSLLKSPQPQTKPASH